MAVVYQENGETIVFPQDEVVIRVGGEKADRQRQRGMVRGGFRS